MLDTNDVRQKLTAWALTEDMESMFQNKGEEMAEIYIPI
jgi:hypothetical protein